MGAGAGAERIRFPRAASGALFVAERVVRTSVGQRDVVVPPIPDAGVVRAIRPRGR